MITLSLEYVDFDRVEFEATLAEGSTRLVLVKVGSGASYRQGIRFPHLDGEAGRSLGDDALDDLVGRRAAEELVRLETACREVRRAR